MASSTRSANRWSRLQRKAAHLSAGGSWATRLPLDTQRNLRFFLFDGVFAAASDAVPLTYLPLFLLALGASNADIGLMTALASLSATLFLIPGASLSDRVSRRKPLILIAGGIIGRSGLLLLALLPLFANKSSIIYAAIAVKVVMDGAGNFALPAWVSMTGDIIPLSWRGRFFGSRNLFMGIAAMLVTYGIGQFITAAGGVGGYQWAFGIAFGVGLLSTVAFSRIHEPDSPATQAKHPSYSLKSLLDTLRSDPNFSAFFFYSLLWNFSLNIAGPFFNVFLVRDLKATAAAVGLVAIAGKIAALPAQQYLGRLADRWGARKLTLVLGFSIPILPFAWIFVQNPYQVVPINLISGVLWAGYNLAMFNLMLEIAPPDQRARYSALSQMAVAASMALGAALGGLISNRWGIPILFAISGAGRLLSMGYFARKVRQPYPQLPASTQP